MAKLKKQISCLTLCMLSVGLGIGVIGMQNADFERANAVNELTTAYKYIDFTTHPGHDKTSGYSKLHTINDNPNDVKDVPCTYYGGQNYNQGWNFVKFGPLPKTATSIPDSTIETTIRIDKKINEIGFNFMDFFNTTYGKLATIKVETSVLDDKTDWKTAATYNVDITKKEEQKITIPEASQTPDSFYKFTLAYNFTKSDKSKNKNGLVQLDYINFYAPISGDVSKVQINIDTAKSYYVGGEETISATVTATGDAQTNIIWSLENCNPVGCATIDESSGLLIAKEKGTCTIKATSVFKDTVFDTLDISILDNPFMSLNVQGNPVEQKAGTSFDPSGLTFTATRTNGGYTAIIPHSDLEFTPEVLKLGANNVTAKIKGTEVSCTINVEAIGVTYNLYQAINNFDDLQNGTEYLLVGYSDAGKKAGIANSDFGTKSITSTITDYSGELFIAESKTVHKTFTVEKAAASFKLVDSKGQYLSVPSATSVGIEGVADVASATDLTLASDGCINTGTDRSLLLSFTTSKKDMKNYSNSNKNDVNYGMVKLFALTKQGSNINDDLTAWTTRYLHMGDTAFDGNGTGLCKNLYKTVKNVLNGLNSIKGETIATFKTEASFADARARFEAWARANGDQNPYDGLEFNQASKALDNFDNSNVIILITVIAILSVSAIAMFAISKRKKATR